MNITKVSRKYWQDKVDYLKNEIQRLKSLGCGKNGYSPSLSNAEKQYELSQRELNYYIKHNL